MARRTLQRNPDTGTKVAMGAAALALIAGLAYYFIRKVKLRITSYQNLTTGETVTRPDILQVNSGDEIKVSFEFDYTGPDMDGKYYVATWQPGRLGIPHDELTHNTKSFTITDAGLGKKIEDSVVVSTAGISPGLYGLYMKITGIEGDDIFSPYYAEIIQVAGDGEVPPGEVKADIADFDFKVTPGSYAMGAELAFMTTYKYKGMAQDGFLTISIGKGIFFTLVYTYDRMPVKFEASPDWAGFHTDGSIILPEGLEPGQTYTIKTEIETSVDYASDKATQGSAFTILREGEEPPLPGEKDYPLEIDVTPAEGGYVTTEPEPIEGPSDLYDGDIVHFPEGIKVMVTAHANEGFEFEKWSDEIEGGVNYSESAYVSGTMTEHKAVKAHFNKIAEVKQYPLEVDITPAEGGYATTEPDPVEGPSDLYAGAVVHFPAGTRVKVTAHANEGYEFEKWSDEIEGGVNYSASAYVSGVMDEHRAVKAHFNKVAEVKLEVLEIDITPADGGYATTSPEPVEGPSEWYNGGTGSFVYGTRVKVTAHANPGYKFEKWSDEIEGGVNYSASAYVSGVMDEHRAVKAHFRLIEEEPPPPADYTLATSVYPAGGGRVTGAGTYKADTYAACEAIPYPGYEFNYWGRDASGTSRYISVYMDRDKSVRAVFKEKVAPPATYTLATSVYPAGGGRVTGAGTYREGTYAACEAIPYPDYEFDYWGRDASGTSRYIRVYMDRNKSVRAVFKKRVAPGQYTVTAAVTPAGAGSVTRDPSKSLYSYGEIIKLTARAASGYRFAYWDKDGAYLSSYNPVTTAVLSSHRITAHFTST